LTANHLSCIHSWWDCSQNSLITYTFQTIMSQNIVCLWKKHVVVFLLSHDSLLWKPFQSLFYFSMILLPSVMQINHYRGILWTNDLDQACELDQMFGFFGVFFKIQLKMFHSQKQPCYSWTIINPHIIKVTMKGVVHFKKKKMYADNLLTPMSSKMSISFFLQSKRN